MYLCLGKQQVACIVLRWDVSVWHLTLSSTQTQAGNKNNVLVIVCVLKLFEDQEVWVREMAEQEVFVTHAVNSGSMPCILYASSPSLIMCLSSPWTLPGVASKNQNKTITTNKPHRTSSSRMAKAKPFLWFYHHWHLKLTQPLLNSIHLIFIH